MSSTDYQIDRTSFNHRLLKIFQRIQVCSDNERMSVLDDLPDVDSFLGIDLKTGSLVIAAICIFHPVAYGCTFFLPLSYLLVTIWILVALFFAASVGMFFGVTTDDALLCTIWVWYAAVFHVAMMMMMVLLIIVFATRRQRNRILVVLIGLLWYLLTIYFILVVNSHRKRLVSAKTMHEKVTDKNNVVNESYV